MAWKCPECGISHEETSQECTCGYSFFKTLGVKPGASQEEVRRAYEYSCGVWGKDSRSSDPVLSRKAGDRLKKIEAAYETYKQYSPPVAGEKKGSPQKAVLAAAAAGFFVLAIAAVFFLSSKDRAGQNKGTTPDADRQMTSSPSSSPVPQATAPGSSQDGPSPGGFAEQPSQVITEEKAIELAKKSDALLKNTSVDMIIRKWTEDNGAKYRVVGWQARKFDEEKILVSYTAMDGDIPKGFYFDVDIRSGAVQDIGRSPELQKKYNILYSK